MNYFERRLNEALEPVESVTPVSFLRFIGAIVTSTLLEKIPMAFQRAAELPPEQLSTIISQTEYTGDMAALNNAVKSKPEYAVFIAKLARRVLPEDQVQVIVNRFAVTEPIDPDFQPGGMYHNADTDEPTEEDPDDDYEDPEPEEEEFHQDADYYTQGNDSGGH